MSGEAERIRSFYESRALAADRWSPRNPMTVYYRHQLERALIDALNRCDLDLQGRSILDVGCGAGPHLRFLAEIGADRRRLHGIDLVPQRIDDALRLAPDIDYQVADATKLPFDDDTFDVVTEFTALCNLTDDELLSAAAAEMQRVLKPDGALIAFDIARARERDPYRAVTVESFRGLFPQLRIEFSRSLFHRWTPYLAGRAPLTCAAIERLPLPKLNAFVVMR